MLAAKPFTTSEKPKQTLCLGLVCIAEYGALEAVIEQLSETPDITLGDAQGNRIPACIFVQRGNDKERIAEIEALTGVMKVDVAYAHTIEEDEVQ